MKRSLAIAIAATVALLAAGCGGGDDAASPTETADEQSLKVGLVTDVGQLNDQGFNQLAYQGLKQAERELGVRGRVLQSATAADYVPNFSSLARQGYDVVIGVGFAQGNAVDTAAVKFPNTRFAIIDVDQRSLEHRPKNVVGLVFREQEAGYLAGALAALTAKRAGGSPVIGSVGGMKEPPVDRFIAGYQAGARAAVPGVTLLNAYSQDWDDQAKCKERALDQISRGARVVFQVAGGCGLGALDAARQEKVWGVGVDADQSYLGTHILTSAEKKVDRAVFLTVRSAQRGTWRGGRNTLFGLAQGGVGLGKISARANRADVSRVEKLEADLVAGKLDVPASLN